MNDRITIGRYFADEWQAALANTGNFFSPDPTGAMTAAELQTIKQNLQSLVDYWMNQVYSNTSPEAIANAQAIADLQQSKLDRVNNLLSKLVPVTNISDGSAISPAPAQKSWLPVLLIAAVALYFFTKRRAA